MPDLSLKQKSFVSRVSLAGAGLSFSAVSITLFVVVLGAIGGLVVLNRSRQAQKEEFIKQNKIKEESLRPELLNQMITLEERLKAIRGLLANHPFVSNVFRVLEADIHPQVRFSNFSFSTDNLKADMAGEAASFRVLAKQITLFEQDAQIDKVEFGGLSITGEGRIGFKISLTLKPTFLHIRQQ